jgi:hypothetical protein
VFLQLPFHSTASLQRITLILNTVIVIAALIVFELVYAEVPKKERTHLKHFYSLFVVLFLLLSFALYKQVRTSKYDYDDAERAPNDS